MVSVPPQPAAVCVVASPAVRGRSGPGPAVHPAAVTDVLVGYRVRARAEGGDAVGEDENGEVVRLIRMPSGDTVGEAALEAWLAADGPHVQRLLDIGCAPNGDVVAVLPEVPIALVDVLASAPLEAAEAVTVLIPIAEALAALHASGVAHGSIGAAAIGLTDAGAPVLLMPRTARRAGGADGDPRDEDRRALAVLARRLLPAPVSEGLLTALEHDPGGAGVEALFLLTEPRPVLLHRSPRGGETARGMPARLVAPARPQPEPEPRSLRPPLLPGLLVTVTARLGRAAHGVRARVWLAAGASLVSLAAGLLLLPGHGVTARPAAATARATAAATPSTPPVTPPAATPVPAAMAPLPAVTALLAARADCIAAGTARCLDVVDAPGSPVEAADHLVLSAGVDAVVPPRVDPVLLRESGATAVLAVGSHTVLAIREPGGWRLRDVIAPAPAAAQRPSEPSKSPSSSRSRTVERNRAASAPSTMRWS